MTTKWKSVRKPNHPIYDALGSVTKNYLEKNDSLIIDLLDDSLKLYDQIKGNPSGFEDYTFVITPSFKALERWIFLIAPSIGITPEQIEKVREGEKSVGMLLNNDLSSLFDEVLNTIDTTSSVKNDLNFEIQSLKSFLKNYRHSIAHCWKTLELPADAELYRTTIINGIRRITEKLIETKIIKEG